MAPLRLERVQRDRWRAACLQAVAAGERCDGLFADLSRPAGEVELRALFHLPDATRVITCAPGDAGVQTLVDVLPTLAWAEREIADLHGVRFEGHEPMRPLLDHSAPLERWTVPVTGPDVHQVAVGPVHAGVIESGHFRFHVVGERVLHLDARLFYKRRGLEAAALGAPLADGIAYAGRACAACAVSNTVAYAAACEAALGLEPDENLRRVRTLLLELERLYNHLNDISAIGAGVGFAAATMTYAALKERAQRLNQSLTAHRFLFNSITVAGSPIAVDAVTASTLREALAEIAAEHRVAWRELGFNRSFADRLDGVGVLGLEDARALGAVGVAARASGLAEDQRTDSPHLHYSGFVPVVDDAASGDVESRLRQRALELEQCFGLLDELLSAPIGAGGAAPAAGPHNSPHASPLGSGQDSAVGVGLVESPRGRTVCLVERDGGYVRALHLRTGSYVNWPVLAATVAGNLLPDFPLINKSFELCYACADR